MYELLIRIETLFLALNTPILLGIGVLLLLVGLVLWLGGSRYSTVIVGLLGAVVGSVAGLLVGQWLSLHLWLCMIVGATVLAAASVLLRNVLILVLAVLVIASLSGAGYVVVVLDRIAPEQPETKAETQSGQGMLIQSFTNMEPSARMQYVDQISKEEGFRERLRAMLDNTWQAVEPHVWKVGLSVLAGGIVAILLVWLIKKALIALSYSVVGTAAILLGRPSRKSARVRGYCRARSSEWPRSAGSASSFSSVPKPRPTPQKNRKGPRNDAPALLPFVFCVQRADFLISAGRRPPGF
jgi:hypothetical protein